MADALLLRAVKGQAKNLNLSNKSLQKLPSIIGKVRSLQTLVLKDNKLSELPKELVTLLQVFPRCFGFSDATCRDYEYMKASGQLGSSTPTHLFGPLFPPFYFYNWPVRRSSYFQEKATSTMY